jgi:hypothetical protein
VNARADLGAGAAPAAPQFSLFGEEELPTAPSGEPYQSIYVHFERLEDIAEFGRLIGLPISTRTRWLRYPFEIPAGPRGASTPPEIVSEPPIAAPRHPLADVDDLLEEASAFGAGIENRVEDARDLVRRLAAALEFACSALDPSARGLEAATEDLSS